MKFFNAKTSRQLRTKVIMLAIACTCCIDVIVSAASRLLQCYELSKSGNEDALKQVLPESVTMIAMLLCCIFILLILWEVRKNKVFTYYNAGLLQSIGAVILLNGFAQKRLLRYAGETGQEWYLIFFLLGLFIHFIAFLFTLGIKMQEEQDLTI